MSKSPTTEKSGLMKDILEPQIKLERIGRKKEIKIKTNRKDKETKLFFILADRKIPKEQATKLNAKPYKNKAREVLSKSGVKLPKARP
jgi:hypothetical protein